MAPVDDGLIAAAVATLRAGELVIYPTETFYGIAADPESPRALSRIFALKGRSPGQPIALIAADAAAAFALAREVPPIARRLAAAFWPGPLTIVLPPRDGLDGALIGADGVGVRVSRHPVARRLSASFGRPITATSANRSGASALALGAEVRAIFAHQIKVILEDDLPLPGGAPSTVIAVGRDACRIIRRGAVTDATIAAALATPEEPA